MTITAKIPDILWEQYEMEIRSLLRPQSKTPMKLRDLMKHMEHRHSLHASIPQWKARLDKWDLTQKRVTKRKASSLNSNDPANLRHGILSHHRRQSSSVNTYTGQAESRMDLTPGHWTNRFMAANFESQLQNNMSNPAQALFDHIKLSRPCLSSLSHSTRTMTEALFLLQRLNGIMREADRDHFKEYVRHLGVLRTNASMSIGQDYPMFFRIAAFFLQINRVSGNSRPGILPIVIGCLHNICKTRFGYTHQVTTMMRSLSLSALFGDRPVRDVSPREWEALRTVQVTALICWLKEYDETCPRGRRRLRVLYGLNDLLDICGMPELQLRISSWSRLIGKDLEGPSAKAPELVILSNVLDQMGAPSWTTSICSPRLYNVLRTSKFLYCEYTIGEYGVSPERKLWSTTLNHSECRLSEHASQRFFFTLDESVDGIISGQTYDYTHCYFVEARTLGESSRFPNEAGFFQVSMNQIIKPNSAFHTETWNAALSSRTLISEHSICARLWFSLAEFIHNWRSKASNNPETLPKTERRRIQSGRIHDGERYVGFTCWYVCLHNLHDLWAILFDFMKTTDLHSMNPIPGFLDVCLETSLENPMDTSCNPNHISPQSGSSMAGEAQALFARRHDEFPLLKCRGGIVSRHPWSDAREKEDRDDVRQRADLGGQSEPQSSRYWVFPRIWNNHYGET